jgi:hypothetical protein
MSRQFKHWFGTSWILILLSGVVAVQAQIAAGTITVGGQFGYSKSSTDGDLFHRHTRTFTCLPTVGYFIKDNIELKMIIGYANSHEENNYGSFTSSSSEKTLIIFPGVRCYKIYHDKIGIYLEGQVGMRISAPKSRTVDGSIIQEYSGNWNSKTFSIIGNTGLDYFPTTKMAVDFQIGFLEYSYSNSYITSSGEKSKFSAFNMSLNTTNFRIGIQFFLGGK